MTPFERIHLAWLGNDPAGDLNRAVEVLAGEGVPRATLDDALGRLLDRVRAEGGSDDQEEAIATVGDRLHGWCHASHAISTNEPATGTPPVGRTTLPHRPAAVK